MSLIFSSPKWYAGAMPGDEQRTPSGQVWRVRSVSEGGRVIEWLAEDGREARSVVAPNHPEYPSDEAVLADKRAKDRAMRQARQRTLFP